MVMRPGLDRARALLSSELIDAKLNILTLISVLRTYTEYTYDMYGVPLYAVRIPPYGTKITSPMKRQRCDAISTDTT